MEHDNDSPMSLEDVRRRAQEKALETPVQEPQADHLINKHTIRPNHIEDTRVLYKSSVYLRDLLGEE
jgi:hypothetical protein